MRSLNPADLALIREDRGYYVLGDFIKFGLIGDITATGEEPSNWLLCMDGRILSDIRGILGTTGHQSLSSLRQHLAGRPDALNALNNICSDLGLED